MTSDERWQNDVATTDVAEDSLAALSRISLVTREQAEVARSAAEAARLCGSLMMDEDKIARYLNPSAHTPYPLEYAYYVLGDVRGKRVLDYGCGDGHGTVVLARGGALVTALDISPDLLAIASLRVARNAPNCEVVFRHGSAHATALPAASFDIVFGTAILHHLDLRASAREVWRILKPGGRAIFLEPVRNSKVLGFLRRLIPFRHLDVSPYERPLTDRELVNYALVGGDGFSRCRERAFALPTTQLVNLIPALRRRWEAPAYRLDAKLLDRFPWLRQYGALRVVEFTKGPA